MKSLGFKVIGFVCLVTAFMAIMIGTAGAAQAQVIEAKDGGHIAAIISAKAINRITLEGDRIKDVKRSGNTFEVTNDSVTGDIYLKYAKNVTPGLIEFFIITEKNRSYHLTLSPKRQPGVTVTIRNGDTDKVAASSFEAKSPFKQGVASLIKSMIADTKVPGYTIMRGPKTYPLHYKAKFKAGSALLMRRTSIYEGDAFVGSVYKVTNVSKDLVEFDETKFQKPSVIGVSISTNRLAPKAVLTLYLVERRAAQ